MNRVRSLREKRGWRLEELAVRADISYGYVRALEASDPPTPGLANARRIAAAFGLTVDEVFPPDVGARKATA
jgi:transcriptional regulator with XRE-family HTH domain